MTRTRPTEPQPVRIEPDNEWAWCGDRRLPLPPKTFAVLRHLVDHAGRLVTKRELLDVVWGETIVSEAALTSCIRDLRKVLTDSSRTPRYIETVHRRGFRFVGPIVGASLAAPSPRPAGEGARVEPDRAAAPARTLVGRDRELARLHDLLAEALTGHRRLVFVAGEAGIGKTTLLEAFLAEVGEATDHGQVLRIGRGQCVEQYGAGEAYLPVLEALGRLGREPDAGQLVRILKQVAPTWLAQLPALLSDSDLEAVQRRAQGTTRDRMLRELVEALDALSVETPLVLLLEDLHWSDSATVDLLAMLGRRYDPARLLIVGTVRPADVAVGGHPLKPVMQELRMHARCEELALEFLGEAAIGEYLAARFPQASLPPEFVRLLRESTGGNPLFLVNVVDDLIAQGHLREIEGAWTVSLPLELVGSAVPHTLSQMVEKQIERLTAEEQAVLAVASVAGAEFSAALSTVAGIDADDGERRCDALARRGQFLRAMGEIQWPDGTIAGRYGFIHAVYRNALYSRVAIGQRVGLHLRIGARLERAYGSHAGDIAGELAMHFEQGRDFERAVLYRGQAADGGLRHYAYREAVNHATRALELLATLPASAQRSEQELKIQTLLGAAVVATSGWGASEVALAYGRARELCHQLGTTPQLFPVLLGLCGYYLMRGELQTAQEIARELLSLAETMGESAVLLGAHNSAGMASFYEGDFATARAHFEQAGRIYDPERHSPNRMPFSVDHDPGVSCAAHGAWTLAALGYPDRAAARMRECLAYARSIDHPVSLVMGLNFAATFYQDRLDRETLQEIEDERHEHATAHGFHLFLEFGKIYRGWLAADAGHGEERIAEMRQTVELYRLVGAALGVPTFLAILATVCDQVGRTEEGLAAIADGLASAESTGMHYWDAELYRIKGTLLLRSAASQADADRRAAAEREAEASFVAGIEVARRQQTKLLELRGAMGLARLRQRQGRPAEARALLSEVHGWFTEGRESSDLIEAAALLDELAGPTKGKHAGRINRPATRRA